MLHKHLITDRDGTSQLTTLTPQIYPHETDDHVCNAHTPINAHIKYVTAYIAREEGISMTLKKNDHFSFCQELRRGAGGGVRG